MHIWMVIPKLLLMQTLQKWLNLHFGPEQSCTNKFCKKTATLVYYATHCNYPCSIGSANLPFWSFGWLWWWLIHWIPPRNCQRSACAVLLWAVPAWCSTSHSATACSAAVKIIHIPSKGQLHSPIQAATQSNSELVGGVLLTSTGRLWDLWSTAVVGWTLFTVPKPVSFRPWHSFYARYVLSACKNV